MTARHLRYWLGDIVKLWWTDISGEVVALSYRSHTWHYRVRWDDGSSSECYSDQIVPL